MPDKIKLKSQKKINTGLLVFLSMAAFLTAFCALPWSLVAQTADTPRAEALEKEAIALNREGSLDKAIETLGEAIKIAPSYASARIQLGNLLIKKGALDEAFQAFDEALKINPELHDAKTGKGMVLSRKGDFKNAETVLKDALTLNPDPVRTHYELGVVYSKLGDTSRALAEYKEGIRKFRQGRK